MILNNKMFSYLWQCSSKGDPFWYLQLLIQLLKTYQVALCWTDSILFMFCCLYGFHTQDAYSSFGRTSVRYAVSLTLWLQPPSTRRKRPRVELAFLQMLSTCSFQLKLLDIVTPRYFLESTLDVGKPFKAYWRLFTCYSQMVTFFNVKIKLPAFLTMKITGQGRFVKLSSSENLVFHYIKYSRQQKDVN